MSANTLEMSKVTFGLQPKDIETIEENLKKFGNNYHSWKMIGEKIGWCPLTACTYYQNYQNKILNSIIANDEAWSLKDILDKLVESANILLLEKDYDGHGWELINSARDRALEISGIIGSKYLHLSK